MGKSPEAKFQIPPVVEVAFQVVFPKLEGINSPHFGVFWASVRDEYSTVQLAPRVGPAGIEIVSSTVPDNRIWLVHKSGQTVIQLQDDRFIFNWRLFDENQSYPGFERLYPNFFENLQRFCDFAGSENSPIKFFTGIELHYVNHIYLGKSVKQWEDAGKAFAPFASPGLGHQNPLTSLRLQSSFDLPNTDDKLAVSIDSRTHKLTKKELLYFEIRVSGSRDNIPLESLDEDFEIAHEHILEAFMKLSTPTIRREWGSK